MAVGYFSGNIISRLRSLRNTIRWLTTQPWGVVVCRSMFPIYFEINFHDPGKPLADRVVQQRAPRVKRKDINNNDRNGQMVGAKSPKEQRNDAERRNDKNLMAQRAESAKTGQPVAAEFNRATMVGSQLNRMEPSSTGRTANANAQKHYPFRIDLLM
uniref:Uncharacterized protein n=1 Tax=Anopheles maculatus TaxID=74869 RepID=A0A182SP82_9DIPT